MAVGKWIVRTVLASVFITLGTIKIVPYVGKDVHKHMSQEFIKFASVFPLKYIGFTIGAKRYMQLTGILEVICGSLLIFSSGSLRTICRSALTVTMVAAIYTLGALRYNPVEFIPAIVCLSLLIIDRKLTDNDSKSINTKKAKMG
ncbi:Uncharacterized protein ZMYM6NB [Trichoplax sp. H2]|nr:Uncharacterized protein ZMYM6NB [Trichoplax sp. H2]|eukprot:RDD41866.1 Uncharacterized protein ZMYM6NB [Trichoplax sp. H2]